MEIKTKKKIASYLFLTATVLAIMSGASEIVAVKNTADKGETTKYYYTSDYCCN